MGIFRIFNQKYVIEEIKYLLELKQMLSTELNCHLQFNYIFWLMQINICSVLRKRRV